MSAPILLRMADKTSTAPYFAERITIHRLRPFRPHDFIDVVAVVGGEGWHVSSASGEPRVQRLAPGMMVLYRPDDEILLRGTQPGGLVLSYVSSPIAEWRMFSSMVGVDAGWMTAPDPPVSHFEAGDPDVTLPFRVALERFRAGATSLDLVQFWIGIIPTMFPTSHRRLGGAGAPEWLTDSVQAMRDETNLRGGVSRFVELAHVSSAHLSVTTRRFFDRTPTELVALLRLRHAAFLLSTTSDSIGEIARRCGFARIAYFSTSFRREYRLTPSEYRARAIQHSFIGPR